MSIEHSQPMADSEITNEAESIDLDRSRGLEDLRNIGPDKCIGYLPLDSLESYYKTSVDEEVERANEHGLKHVILSSEESPIGFKGAIYVYSEQLLNKLLGENIDILGQAGWPVESEEFVRRLAVEHVSEDSPILPIIQKAFGDLEEK